MLKHRLSLLLCLLIACNLWLVSCNTIDLYERVVPVPQHQWQASFKPEFTFNIKDTASLYRLYFIIRHNNKYNYNNIWVQLKVKGPSDTAHSFRLELPLANKEGWLAKGMDDVFEHWIQVNNQMEGFNAFKPVNSYFQFSRAGAYSFTLSQIMRDDPLPDIMNVGIRIEKQTPQP